RSDVFWRTGAAVDVAGIEKLPANAPVHSDSVCDFFNIGAARVANRGDGVDVGNFQSEKRIRRVLNELGAVNSGYEHGRHERLVNLFHQIDSVLTLRANHDAVRM